jgi:hypothetical protein
VNGRLFTKSDYVVVITSHIFANNFPEDQSDISGKVEAYILNLESPFASMESTFKAARYSAKDI